MNPSQEVRFYDFNENYVVVRMITLVTWVHGLRAYVDRGIDIRNIRGIVREKLSAPADYPAADLLAHLEAVKAECDQMLGIGPEDEEPEDEDDDYLDDDEGQPDEAQEWYDFDPEC